MESLRHLSEWLDSFWRLRRLELKADYVVEASIHMIVLFCVKSAIMLIYINGRRSGAQAFIIQCQILHAGNNITIVHDIYRAALT